MKTVAYDESDGFIQDLQVFGSSKGDNDLAQYRGKRISESTNFTMILWSHVFSRHAVGHPNQQHEMHYASQNQVAHLQTADEMAKCPKREEKTKICGPLPFKDYSIGLVHMAT